MEVNPKTTAIALNALGGALVPIILTIMARKVEIIEDPSVNQGAPQGLTGFYADTQPGSGFPQIGTQKTWLPQTAGQVGSAFQPIIFGGQDGGLHGGLGNYVGAQSTVVLYLTSNSQTPTQILLTEWP